MIAQHDIAVVHLPARRHLTYLRLGLESRADFETRLSDFLV